MCVDICGSEVVNGKIKGLWNKQEDIEPGIQKIPGSMFTSLYREFPKRYNSSHFSFEWLASPLAVKMPAFSTFQYSTMD